MEFLLKAHKPMCTVKAVIVKSEAQAGTSRPTSLPLAQSTTSTTGTVSLTNTGVVISTPSAGMFAQIGLDSMVDGHTGLTPITGVPSCSTQVKRNSSDSSEGLASPTSLMAL